MRISLETRRLRLALLLSVVVATPGLLQAQNWQPQYPPHLPSVADVDALSALNAWVAGVDGTLRHTLDGGVNWTERILGAASLARVQFASGGVGLAAGDGIWRTTDAGQSWSRRSTVPVRALAFQSGVSAWALAEDGRLLRSTNGGAAWTDLGFAIGASAPRDLFFFADGRGWACGAMGELFSTLDGGSTWTSRSSGSALDLERVHFVDANTGWLAAGSTVLRTTNGGASWSSSTLPPGAVVDDVHFLTTSRGSACGPGGTVLWTTNGGVSWTAGAGVGTTDLAAVEASDFYYGWAAGADGRVYRTSNGGAAWTQVAGGAAAPVPAVFGIDALDDLTAWAATYDGFILRTTDGGAAGTPVPSGVHYQWRDVSFADALHGYACGKKQNFTPAFARTNDGGLSWIPVDGSGLIDLFDVEALGPNTALAAGDTFVFRTTNGGLNWNPVTPQPLGTFHGMDFVDAQTGWIAGSQIFRTDDSGQTWTHQATPAVTLLDVGFADASTGWCVGVGAVVMKTIDGGQTWTSSTIPGFAFELEAVSVVSATTLWVAGAAGFVARSTDGGANWSVEHPGLAPNAPLLAAKFPSASRGWIAGNFDTGVWARSPAGASCPAPAPYCTGKTNSAGSVCQLFASGSPSLSTGAFAIAFQGGLPGNLAFFAWTSAGAGSAPFQGGTLCLAQPFVRMQRFHMDGLGGGSQPIAVTPAMVNTTRWYQLFYRDAAHVDGTGWGLSNGIAVTFCD
ncbi:MAG: hypothetical protein IPJ77_11405 [Planctomycetes bacterium]|nr:hypothetical protein [Planctomycetota bacterium]